ncbi:hypothetical protein F5Y15DRAFT_406648 [Xylariaceae sp. FL0016]|nr:hypothetical protein F5Y15DRAFT_406648 [Xylariaceae sp. FL0016]
MASPGIQSASNTVKPRPTKIAITPVSAASSPGSAASPNASSSTPTSTYQLAIKPAVANAVGPKSSITSKEWVIPPRPKPGRKPATDTPPTKRKAQNRAAQRAFRERRAARVGELEEQLDEQREEYDRVQQGLRDQVQGLDTEVQTLRDRCAVLDDLLDKERVEKSRMADELDSLRRRWAVETPCISSRNGSFATTHGRAPSIVSQQAPRGSLAKNVPDHRNSATAFSISQIISPPDESDFPAHSQPSTADPSGCGGCDSNGPCACVDDVLTSTAIGCGNCSVGTKCACLEAALNFTISNSESELKRRPSSISALEPEEKRQKSDHYPNEIDFTSMFSSKKKQAAKEPAVEPIIIQPAPQHTIPPRDSCGFCTEGTYCMCAEAAAAAASQSLAPMGSQVQTPPPSETDVGPAPMEVTSTGAIKLPGINSLNRASVRPVRPSGGGCGANGPGTCAQCLGDAKSGLFCRSLAARFTREQGMASGGSSSAPSGGCCGGSGGSGGCCKSGLGNTNTSAPTAQPNSNPALGLSLSCADAYKTLSSHRNFERAADEIGSWLPKLKAKPQESARLPIEVETASIMGVLKEFDVRFGREG